MAYPVLLVQKGREKGMTDYTELVKALRICSSFVESPSCAECSYSQSTKCKWVMMTDAAAAIEELQAEVDTLKRTDAKRCQECLYLGQPVEQQLPKRGEWIETEEKEWGIYPFKKQTCSVCDCKIDHIFMLACMDYFDDRDTVFHYCPNCGAKMEVQE